MKLSLFRNVLRNSARMAMLVFVLGVAALATQAQVVFSPPKNISNSSGNTNGQQIAVDSRGSINVVWRDNSSGAYAVLFSRSTDGGNTFSPPLMISHAGSTAGCEQIILDSSANIYVAWCDNSPGNDAEFFSRSTDGVTFSAPQLVASGAGQMAVDSSGNIDATLIDNSTGTASLFFSRSTDGGSTFSPPVNLSNQFPQSQPFQQSLAVDAQGNIYVAWIGVSRFISQYPVVFFSYSTDGGATFSATKLLGGAVIYEFPDSVQVLADSTGNVYVVWETNEANPDSTSASVSYVQSSDAGASFGAITLIGGCRTVNGFVYHPMRPHTALDSLGGLNIAEQGNCNGFTARVGFARYVGGGLTAEAGWDGAATDQPTQGLAVDSSNDIDVVFVGGTSGTPGPGFWFTQSTDSGATFSPTQPISVSTAISNPEITTGGGNSYVVWEQADSSGNANVFFSRGTALLLSALGVSVPSVTGGTPVTGTLTLNAAAPSGGAVVSLSSSDPSVAVPATVTIPEGATSKTFSVTTSPVATATTATVSAVFNGVTQTATITVEPPVLTSLTLNPSSTMGGSSSTGTVTLSGPAPAGGSVVAVSSSNTSIATVPSSVTVAPGLTSVTFTVSTSRQLCPNSATISASFSGVTQTSNLAVMPFVNLPAQACAAIGARGSTTVGMP